MQVQQEKPWNLFDKCNIILKHGKITFFPIHPNIFLINQQQMTLHLLKCCGKKVSFKFEEKKIKNFFKLTNNPKVLFAQNKTSAVRIQKIKQSNNKVEKKGLQPKQTNGINWEKFAPLQQLRQLQGEPEADLSLGLPVTLITGDWLTLKEKMESFWPEKLSHWGN